METGSALDNVVLTTLSPVVPPTTGVLKRLTAKNKIGKKLRTFEIVYANDFQVKLSDTMEKFDVWRYPRKYPITTATITTHSTLEPSEYRLLIAAAMQEADGLLFDLVEIVGSDE